MLRTLLPLCDAVVTTRAQTPRALPPATLASLCHQLGYAGTVEIVGEARAALERARALAGPDGVALATGSIYLIADLLRPAGAAAEHAVRTRTTARASASMIALVAVSVALVILIFFGIGYGFGRLFL